jgi:hypothetical protein
MHINRNEQMWRSMEGRQNKAYRPEVDIMVMSKYLFIYYSILQIHSRRTCWIQNKLATINMEWLSIPSPVLRITRIKNTKIITSMTKLQNNRIAINNKTNGNIKHLHLQNNTVISANTKNEIRVVTTMLKK